MKRSKKIYFVLLVLLSFGVSGLLAETYTTDTSDSRNDTTEHISFEEPTNDDEDDPTLSPLSIEWIFELLGL